MVDFFIIYSSSVYIFYKYDIMKIYNNGGEADEREQDG